MDSGSIGATALACGGRRNREDKGARRRAEAERRELRNASFGVYSGGLQDEIGSLSSACKNPQPFSSSNCSWETSVGRYLGKFRWEGAVGERT